MSKNCVDAAIEIAAESGALMMLIASRRQIDAEIFGGGYVNNWSTEGFCEYVNEELTKIPSNLILARDHGGPWQNPKEIDVCQSVDEAMSSAKASFKVDIDSGMQLLHVDPSVAPFEDLSLEQLLSRSLELIAYCSAYAESIGRDIDIEIGTEEQTGLVGSLSDLESMLSTISTFCADEHIKKPKFVVVQTGTRVVEMTNEGRLASQGFSGTGLPVELQLPKAVELCSKFGMGIKQHNTDYLNDHALTLLPRAGVVGANVAPEFGVVETRTFIALMKLRGTYELIERFVDLTEKFRKWEKWLKPNSSLDKYGRCLVSGHYVFATEEFRELKSEFCGLTGICQVELDSILKYRIKESISRYLRLFGWWIK